MKLQLLARRYGAQNGPQKGPVIGLARYSFELQKALRQIGVAYTCVEPAYPLPARLAGGLLRPLGYDLKTFLANYPIAARLENGAVTHLSAQMMATLLSFKPGLQRVVVTVHDIVPYLVKDDPQQSTFSHPFDRFFDNLAMQNLRKADRLIAVSSYTREMLVRHLSIPPEKIRVVNLGLDGELFYPAPVVTATRERLGLSPDYRYLLYVGSENPRKNLAFLMRALAEVKQRVPNVRLLKVGGPEYPRQRNELKLQIAGLGLSDTVIFLESVSQADLADLYRAADAFVFSSLYEGFGFPPLEALGCGTPVVCSSAASLPEVVGEAALLVDPQDLPGWVEAIQRILLDNPLRLELKRRGIDRAGQFTWERTARQTLAVYQELL